MADDDWVKTEREHEVQMAKVKNFADQDRRQSRNQMIGYIASAMAFVLGTVALALAIYGWQKSSGERSQQIEQACIEAGGTWTGIGGGTDVCVRIEEMPK